MQDDAGVPGFTATPELQAKLEGLDDNLNPIGDLKENDKSEDKAEVDTKEDKKEEQKDEETEPESNEDEAEETEEEASSESEDDGYAIDEEDDDEEEDTETPEVKEEVKQPNLSPEDSYILDNLQPIKVRGTVGDGEVKEYEVLSPEQLPQGFKYIDERELSIANKNFSLLENKALQLQTDFRTQQTNKAAQKFKAREDNADRTDIGQLQRDGTIPKFKTPATDPKFNDDPAVKLVQEVLDFKEKTNDTYMQEYNAGRPYRHIGFKEAFVLYKKEQPAKADIAQAKEDKERLEVAKRINGNKSDKAGKDSKPMVRSGMSSRDLEALLEARTRDW